jgi:hypothetical protein
MEDVCYQSQLECLTCSAVPNILSLAGHNIVRKFFWALNRLPPHGARRFSFGGAMNWMAILFAVGGVAMVSASQTLNCRPYRAVHDLLQKL